MRTRSFFLERVPRTLAVLSVSVVLLSQLTHANLLTAGYEAQLEAWLGQGDVSFTNVFTKTTGSTPFDFHTAADGKGASFTIARIEGNGGVFLHPISEQIVGGYNPLSWAVSGNSGFLNVQPSDAGRDAFLFNLTDNHILRQKLKPNFPQPDVGSIQTINQLQVGPAFGGGADLYLGNEGDDFSQGFTNPYGYGIGVTGQETVVFGGDTGSNFSQIQYFFIRELEVYTFAPAYGVPDGGSTISMLGAALASLATLRRRQRSTHLEHRKRVRS